MGRGPLSRLAQLGTRGVASAAAVVVGVAAVLLLVRARHSPATPALVPAPRSAISAVQLAGNRIAVLAGDSRAKAISIVDMATGTVTYSFGVDANATGMTALTGEGPLLISVAVNYGTRRSVGGLQRWTVDGTLTGTLALPGAALSITRALDGTAYVLVANRSSRTAIPVSVWSLQTGARIPLEAGDAGLQYCRFGPRRYLALSTAGGRLALRPLPSGRTIASAVGATSPGCAAGQPWLFALARSSGAATLAVLTVPALSQISALPVASTVVSLYDAGGGAVGTLNSTAQVSTLLILPPQMFAAVGRGNR